jgi:uncharacterized membrane protein YhaH (DUF805 family)
VNFNFQASIIATVIVIALLVLFYTKREQDETALAFKLTGYYLLGAFLFTFNGIPVPLGFLIYLLFFRPPANVGVKRLSAALGLVMALLGKVLPL